MEYLYNLTEASNDNLIFNISQPEYTEYSIYLILIAD